MIPASIRDRLGILPGPADIMSDGTGVRIEAATVGCSLSAGPLGGHGDLSFATDGNQYWGGGASAGAGIGCSAMATWRFF
ncbi:hypothetical protein [Microbacterium sp. LWH13-1.2]|uniref:hypothetical protein n=1 Tax=Microbacterium sp. LWH13-1.2 TaxID=3135260 RepID=UPI00313A00D7